MKPYPVGVFPRVLAIAVILLFGATAVGHAGGKVAAWGDNYYGQCILPNGLKNVKAITAGYDHSLALKSDGTVVGWGRNAYGQATPPLGLSSVVAITAGGAHCLALRANGTVVAWGYNNYGQANIPDGLSHVTSIAAGGAFSLALKADGTVVAWGFGSYGLANPPVGLSDVVAITASALNSFAVKADGTVIGWGYPAYGLTNIPVGLSNVTAIAAGLQQALALRADGTVVSWGYSGTNAFTGFSNIVALAAGPTQSLALQADGTVVGWGLNGMQATNLPAGISNVLAIAAGTGHALAIVPAGPPEISEEPGNLGVPFQSNVVFSVVASGFEPLSYQWLFNGVRLTETARIFGSTSASLSIANAQFADIGTYTVIVSNAFGSVQSSGAVLTVISPPIITTQPLGQTVIAGTNISLSLAAIGTPPLAYQWLLESVPIVGATKTSLNLSNIQSGQSGDYSVIVSNAYGTLESSNALVTVLESPPYILNQPTNRSTILGGFTTFVVNARGSTPVRYQWRFNGTEIPGATDAMFTLTSLHYDHAGFYSVAISNAFGSIVSSKAELTVRQVAVWGATIPVLLPTNVSPGLTNLVAISANDSYVLGLNADGTVAIWGNAVRLTSVPTNVPPGLSNVIAIAAGGQHCLALKSNGTVIAWGGASGSWLPYPATPSPTNVPAALSNVIAIAAGDSHSLALKSDGRVVSWGNYYKSSSVGGPWLYPAPATNVPAGLSNVIAIAAGDNQNIALKSDGRVVAWGYGTNVPISLSNVIAVACADGYNLALKSDGHVIAWATAGASPYPWPKPLPKYPVNTNVPPTLSNVVAIAAGGYGMALKADGSVTAWGTSTILPVPPTGISNIFAISAGGSFMAALVGDGAPHFTIHPASQSVAKGTTVQFHARAAGVQPLSYQWKFNGANLPGATSADLTITNALGNDSGTYQAVTSNARGTTASISATLTIPFSTNLAAALNATNLFWSNTIPAAPWFAQLQETHDGDVAAQSGDITDGQQSVLQTTVTGPGTLAFWWKVSSEEGYDFLKLFVDGATSPLASVSGGSDWQQVSFAIGSGMHTVTWSYAKDGSVSSGVDAGWLDEVVFTPAPAITLQPLEQAVWVGSNVTFHATATNAVIAFYQWLKNGTNLPGAFGSLLTLPNVCRRDAGDYALRVANAGGTATSSNAALVVRVPQSLAAPRFLPDDTFVFASGDADGGWLLPEDLAAFEVQASTNLHDWITLTNACSLTNGSLLLHDPGSARHPQRFYRLMER